MLAPPESSRAGSSAAGGLSFRWDGLMRISLMDSDPQLSHRAAQFPWNLDFDGPDCPDLGPGVLSVPELMS